MYVCTACICKGLFVYVCMFLCVVCMHTYMHCIHTCLFVNIYVCVCLHVHMCASQVVLVVKNLPSNARDLRDMGLIPGSGRPPQGGYGNPLQYSWLENPMERGAWRMCLPQTWAGSGSSNAVMEASEEAKTASGDCTEKEGTKGACDEVSTKTGSWTG